LRGAFKLFLEKSVAKYRNALPQLRGATFLADGGIETHMIFNEGVDAPHNAVFTMIDSEAGRAQLRRYYRGYLPIAQRAGTGFLFDTNTWRANPDWGTLLGYNSERLRAANLAAVALCEEIAADFEAAGVPTIISGAIGPRRDAWQYDAEMTVSEAIAYHTPQVAAFADSGADMVSVYTLTNTPEAIGIATAAQRAGIPCALSFTLETDGRQPGGKPLPDAIAEVDEATGGYPAYYMINCVHPVHFTDLVEGGGGWLDRVGGLRTNASMKSHAELDESETLDIGDPQDLARRYRRLLELMPGIRVIGGCCGTDHRHIAAVCDHCKPLLAA
jgi:homocysteine S-methyltransferase